MASAAAARCVLLLASPTVTAKFPSSVPPSSSASASAPLGTAVATGRGRRIPAPPLRCSSSSPENLARPDLGLLLEVEGKARGDEERMLVLFFDSIGWPTSLPTSEKGSFIKSVLREKLKALEEFSASDSLPLRPGVEKFIDDALSERVPLAILVSYGRNGENISRSIVMKLGPERMSKIKIVGKVEVEESFYGQLVLGKGVTSGLDEQLLKAAQKAASAEKQRIAEEVASVLKLSVDITASESSDKVIAALRAGSEYVGCDVQNCVLVAGGQSGVLAAERIGMPCIVVRSSFTARAEFHLAKATMDGFRGTDLTVSKLMSKKWS